MKAELAGRPVREGLGVWLAALIIAFVVMAGATDIVLAQSPTAEQMRMINQLPPAQRQQALQALEQYRGAQSQTVGQPVREVENAPGLSQPLLDPETVAREPRASANSRLVITSTLKDSLSAAEIAEISNDPLLSRLEGDRTFVLDETGLLSLFGVQSIALLGLSETDIERRLSAEPLFEPFDVIARILDTQPTGAEALEPFGYEIFEPHETSFDPPMTGPVPQDYVLGPGDSVRVQLFGNVNGIYEFDVTRDGILNLPEIGPITVTGLPFSEFRADLKQRVNEMLIGTQVSITMGQLRTIRVFVLGDANRPGSYVVGSLATISSALYRSGGISRIGSLRNIQLKRNGVVVARLDLYDLLLHGDTSGDERLQPGDAIFVPPIGAQVSVSGAVKRPAIYETKKEGTVADIVRLSGGLTPDAFPDGARIERIDAGQERVVIGIDVDSEAANRMVTHPGDVLTIPKVLPELQGVVTLVGHVRRPGPYPWHDGMRLADLVRSLADLRSGADLDYVLIRREAKDTRRVRAVSANLTAALQNPNSADNVALHSRDTVLVFGLAFGRQRAIQPILDELQLQSHAGEPYQEVSVSGHVKAPGRYPHEVGMRVTDLLRAGGGLSEQAYTLDAELTRYAVMNGEIRTTDVINVDLGAVLQGVESADLVLTEHDSLSISTVPEWNSEWTVNLEGEVRFPGQYRIRRGENLQQLLERAGGLTEEAFPEGAIFLRESLRLREQEQIEVLASRMEADLAALSLESANTTGADTLETGRALLDQLRGSDATGRLVIDISSMPNGVPVGGVASTIELRHKDRLLVPTQSQVVTVIGETQQNTSHLFQAGNSRDDYISMSGGLTRRADKKLIYVVRASGAVMAGQRSKWFGRRSNVEIRPGDTIVVPVEIDRIRPLAFWGSVTQILYQGAIAVAAIQTFSN